jgi:putative endonuclease
MTAFVYILSNNTNTTVYTGVTNDLPRRIDEHRRHMNPDSFTAKYDITKLVYYERHENVWDAIAREKQIKGWNRKRKNDLVNSLNPDWKDLFPGLLEE